MEARFPRRQLAAAARSVQALRRLEDRGSNLAADFITQSLRLRGTAPASQVIDALLILYERIAAAQAELGPHVEAFEHRDLEITSSLPIDLPARLADLRSLIPETGTDPAMVGTPTV